MKNIVFIAFLAITAIIGGCRKDSALPNSNSITNTNSVALVFDYRDTIVGDYNYTEIWWQNVMGSIDSGSTNGIIHVAKIGNSDSIIIGGGIQILNHDYSFEHNVINHAVYGHFTFGDTIKLFYNMDTYQPSGQEHSALIGIKN